MITPSQPARLCTRSSVIINKSHPATTALTTIKIFVTKLGWFPLSGLTATDLFPNPLRAALLTGWLVVIRSRDTTGYCGPVYGHGHHGMFTGVEAALMTRLGGINKFQV